MTIDTFIRYGSLWTLILGVVSLMVAIRNYRRQVNAQIFFEIASRYHQMLQSFPIHEWTTRLEPKYEALEPPPEVKAGVLHYMAIVHFGFILHELRYLSKDLWKILQAEHHRTLASPLFKRQWSSLRDEFILFPTFLRYVDSIQNGDAILGSHTGFAASLASPGSWRVLKNSLKQEAEIKSVNCDPPK
ncbi:MAG TPA: hypothetical protein VH351_10160 [Bryobacteraceae bacterium]|nr:hypothetical protein [Bryobacteraceae bacterium]